MLLLKKLLMASVAVALVSLLACSTNVSLDKGLINRLKNRGPIALSSENPYLAANIFVSKEAEKSKVIRGFVKYRGAPKAVEVRKDTFQPLRLHFYYPESREYFVLEEIGDTWIVDGPKEIPDEVMTNVAKLTRNIRDEPLLTIDAPTDSPAEQSNLKQQSAAPAPAENMQVETPAEDSFVERLNRIEQEADKETTAEKSKSAKKTPVKKTKSVKAKGSELNLIRELQQDHKNNKKAEITPNGDVVHHVTYPGENLSMIARWYTHDVGNIGRLSRLNKLDNPNSLQVGDMIVIPSYLVKNTYRLTEGAVSALRSNKR